MGFVTILGILTLGLGPLAALFVIAVMPYSEQVIVFGSATFFQLISITLRAVLWAMIPPLKTSIAWNVILGALVHEAVRGLFFQAYRRTEVGFSMPKTHRANSSVSAGVGFGAAQLCLMFLAVTMSASGPGALYLPTCTSLSAYSLTALNGCAFGLLEVFATVAAFKGWETARSGGDGTLKGFLLTGKPLLALVFLIRLLASAVSAGNTGHQGCGAVVGAEFAFATMMGMLAGGAAYRPASGRSAPL